MDVYGLLGSPVDHSLSPPMHEAAYDDLGLNARYVTFEPDDAAAAVAGAADLGVAGLNVTVPFKRDVLAAVEPTPRARRVGAVNTVDFATDPPTGDNTDVAGVRRAFAHHDVSLDGTDAVVIGAGGAGRAATAALAESAASVHVANRTVERAETLVADLRGSFADGGEGGRGGEEGRDTSTNGDTSDPGTPSDGGLDATLTAGGLDGLTERVPSADVLVNATSVGMEAPEATPVPAELLHEELAVLDAVYTPLDTRLLREGAAAGAETVDGAWMLLFQGAVAFERWTGHDAPVAAMNEALRAEL
ncbi:shikimate dehydrogenase [Halobaculum sp. MBLA0147]|uniref:shikimate dehydrogenase family protein n=1 Tax=Halobaculum sp. MBLA0147 TaxID=3079934 RepID=UPI0035262E00